MMQLSSQKAFFNLFIDSERHFLFNSFFPGKFPFQGSKKQFSTVLLLFLLWLLLQ